MYSKHEPRARLAMQHHRAPRRGLAHVHEDGSTNSAAAGPRIGPVVAVSSVQGM